MSLLFAYSGLVRSFCIAWERYVEASFSPTTTLPFLSYQKQSQCLSQCLESQETPELTWGSHPRAKVQGSSHLYWTEGNKYHLCSLYIIQHAFTYISYKYIPSRHTLKVSVKYIWIAVQSSYVICSCLHSWEVESGSKRRFLTLNRVSLLSSPLCATWS